MGKYLRANLKNNAMNTPIENWKILPPLNFDRKTSNSCTIMTSSRGNIDILKKRDSSDYNVSNISHVSRSSKNGQSSTKSNEGGQKTTYVFLGKIWLFILLQ